MAVKLGSSDDSLDNLTTIEEGVILDYITEKPKKDTPKEQVRQRIARALLHEYGISVNDMASDFPVKVDGKRKKIDIAIFTPGAEHTVENMHRVVVCKPEPKIGKTSVVKLRDPKQAEGELQELYAFMASIDSCHYGMWTNGIELFFFKKKQSRFDTDFEPIGDWPLGDESLGSRDVVSSAHLRRADPEMLRTAFRRCHNFIHGNEGMPKDAAFWQFLYLIFAKLHDEKLPNDLRQFYAAPTEMFDPEGQTRIRERVVRLFGEVRNRYPILFNGREELTLSDRALAFMVNELARYDLGRTDVDAKGLAYQEIVGPNLRGDRGQYFTPRGVVRLAVQILDPKANERVFDPACGTGGFLEENLGHQLRRFRKESGMSPKELDNGGHAIVMGQLADYAKRNVFGADFDPFLVKASTMSFAMATNTSEYNNIFYMDSLAFPDGHLDGRLAAQQSVPLGSIDVIMTNPPFGSDIPVTDPMLLGRNDLAKRWEKGEAGEFRNLGIHMSSVAPEVLFIEQCVRWLRPGGRMGIVLPNGILGNPGDEYIRRWILRNCWVLASVEIPVEAFIVEANVNILTSLLFLKKKTDEEIRAEDFSGSQDYPVFMAIAEKVGFDRRGNTLYKRQPDGEEQLFEEEDEERVHIGGEWVTRILKRKQRRLDDDLPRIAEAYSKFRAEHGEPSL